jgi:Neuraminidase (sialidase)
VDARHLHAGTFGDDYPRALSLADGSWLLVFTSFAQGDSGYRLNPSGGNVLVVLRSKDDGRNWTKVSVISDPGRDMDNGEMIQLADGSILLAARSVRWQESYRLPIYKSTDFGATWKVLSSLDSNEGKPGELGTPDKGVYEPHFYQITPGILGVMFSTEKHVVESPSYSQTVAEKISTDGGRTWGKEIWVAEGGPLDRPGMPVWTRMKNGRFIVVYEVCGPQACTIYSKISADGMHWDRGLGMPIPLERGAPYVLRLADGRLVLTANNHRVAVSSDNGESWNAVKDAFPGGPKAAFFSSIYEVSPNHILLMTGQERSQGGRRIAIRDGEIVQSSSTSTQ